jgi:CDGSH-type Zn-finger protein
MNENQASDHIKKIVVLKDGPYRVSADLPLVHKTQVVSEFGEPLTWKKEGSIPTDGVYYLCRCGASSHKPFCDGSHHHVAFDSLETADSLLFEQRQEVFKGDKIIVKRDDSLCMDSGFCGFKDADILELVDRTQDTQVRALVMAMIERCPSGALSYAIAEGEADIEPDLPQQVAATTEITSQGAITGPIWVTGGVPVLRADGQPFETRNRVTLCNCGRSACKPLCDGVHRREAKPVLP